MLPGYPIYPWPLVSVLFQELRVLKERDFSLWPEPLKNILLCLHSTDLESSPNHGGKEAAVSQPTSERRCTQCQKLWWPYLLVRPILLVISASGPSNDLENPRIWETSRCSVLVYQLWPIVFLTEWPVSVEVRTCWLFCRLQYTCAMWSSVCAFKFPSIRYLDHRTVSETSLTLAVGGNSSPRCFHHLYSRLLDLYIFWGSLPFPGLFAPYCRSVHSSQSGWHSWAFNGSHRIHMGHQLSFQ